MSLGEDVEALLLWLQEELLPAVVILVQTPIGAYNFWGASENVRRSRCSSVVVRPGVAQNPQQNIFTHI